MSNILRRPMFRGGRVDSRGTGITSGLGYAKGGQIGGGTIYGNPMSDGRYGFANPSNLAAFLAKQAGSSTTPLVTGGQLTTKLLPQSFLTGMEGLGTLTRSSAIPLSLAASPFLIFGNEDPLINKPEEKELQDTATMLTESFLSQPRKKLMEDVLSGTKTKAESPYADFDTEAAGREAREAEQKYFLQKDKKTPLPVSTAADLAFATGMPDKGKTIEDDSTIDTTKTGGVSSESTDITLDDYIRMLGGDKARQRDIGDIFGRLSAAALKRPGRGEQRGVADILGDFMTAEVAAGPGRREKIEQTAAMLDIKDKIESKRSKENIKQLMAMEVFKNQVSAKNLAANITDAKKGESNTTRAILDGVQRTYPNRTARVVKENLPQVTEENIGDIYIVEKMDPATKVTSRYVIEIAKDASGNLIPKSIYTAQ